MADQKGKDMLKEEELNQVAGGGWLESGMDERFAKEYEKYGIKVLSKSIFGENTYSYKGQTYESQTDMFKQLESEGLMEQHNVFVTPGCSHMVYAWKR